MASEAMRTIRGLMVSPLRLHKCHDHFSLILTFPFPATLVIRLAANTDETASSLNAQSFDLTTTDSLPDDFFTVTSSSSKKCQLILGRGSPKKTPDGYSIGRFSLEID